MLPVLLLHTATVRAGRAAGVRGRRGVVALTSAVTATYAVIVTVVALLARTDRSGRCRRRPSSVPRWARWPRRGPAPSGRPDRASVLWHRLPARVRAVLPPAAAAGAALVAGGALLVGGSLAVHHGRAVDLTAGLGAGIGGGLLLAARLHLLPADRGRVGAGLLCRAGFRGRGGNERRVLGADLGAVPAVPLLAGLPSGTGSPAWWLVLLVPAAAGVLAGLVADRTAGRLQVPGHGSWRELAETSAGIGAVVGLGVAFLGWLASGLGRPRPDGGDRPDLVAGRPGRRGRGLGPRGRDPGAAAGGPRTALTAGARSARYRRRR